MRSIIEKLPPIFLLTGFFSFKYQITFDSTAPFKDKIRIRALKWTTCDNSVCVRREPWIPALALAHRLVLDLGQGF